MKPVVTTVLALMLAAGAANDVHADSGDQAAMFRATTLSLAAHGETRAKPDMATITLGVQTEAPTAAEALKQNAERMNQVIAALKRGGIPERDLQTSGLSINPVYVYQENLPPRLTGYQASNQVTATVRDLDKLGQAVDASVNAGANNVGGIGFGLEDSVAAENSARQEAIKALQAKAELYAAATGHRIARLVNLSEGGGYSPPPPMPMVQMMKREAAMDSTPVEAGELRIRIDVNATYELTR